MKPEKWRERSSLGGELLSQPCGETNLDIVICLSYIGVRPTDTYTVELHQPMQSVPCCYDTALKELIECT